jgi:diguanylate cyclase (GGDEF)-like protein
VGDQVLIESRNRLSAEFRDSDYLVRWGGEEFLILLPLTDLEEAEDLAERLRKTIEEEFAETIPLTISLGVTQHRPSDSMNTLLSRADDALYSAKKKGRNRAVSKA